jgi:hypothetical protein
MKKAMSLTILFALLLTTVDCSADEPGASDDRIGAGGGDVDSGRMGGNGEAARAAGAGADAASNCPSKLPARGSACTPPASCNYASIVCICSPRDGGYAWNCIPVP